MGLITFTFKNMTLSEKMYVLEIMEAFDKY